MMIPEGEGSVRDMAGEGAMPYNPSSSPIQAVAVESRLHGTNVLYRHGASSDKGQACVGLMSACQIDAAPTLLAIPIIH